MKKKTMKKNIISVASAVLATLLLSVSCSKQESIQSAGGARTFTASIEQGLTKTYLSDSLSTEILWNENDLICINGYSLFSAKPTGNGTTAEFRSVGDVKLTAPYHAYYPSSIFDRDKGPVLPQTQKYEAGRLNTPMYALGTSENLEFKNICGILRLSVKTKSGEATIDSIKVHIGGDRSVYLWGPFSVDGGYNAVIDKDKAPQPYMGMPEEENPTIGFLDCGDGVVINDSEPTSFFIYLPPVSNGDYNLTLGIFNTERKNVEFHVNGEFSIERNKLYHLDLEVEFPQQQEQQGQAEAEETVEICQCDLPENALSVHVFTVGEGPADMVYFSKGNLVATYDGSNFSFGFAENQYDFIGNSSGNSELFNWYGGGRPKTNDKIDLFCWSTGGNTSGGNTFGVYESTNSPFVDWGGSVTPSDTWRTLTGGAGGEWEYLLDKREVNNGKGSGYSYEILNEVSIAGETVSGIAIFPDDFTDQSEWKSKYTDWSSISTAGIVFLPKAGWGYCAGYTTEFWGSALAYLSSSIKYSFPYGVLCNYNENESAVNSTYGFNATDSRASVRLVANAFTIVSPAAKAAEQAEGEMKEGK